MSLAIALLLGLASAIPLIVLVTRADQKRRAVDALRLSRERGTVTQEEFGRRVDEVLSRSCWVPQPRRSADVPDA